VRTRLAVLLALGLLGACAPASSAGPVVTVAVGPELGFGPSARLKAWQDEARGLLCARVHIPFRVVGRPGANRGVKCMPYPPRRALTHRIFVFDECYVGGRILVGITSPDVARVDVTIGFYDPPFQARMVRSPRLTPAGGFVHALLGEDNKFDTYDAEGRRLSSKTWGSVYPSCPSRQVEFL
jgi:hypothetical protein